MARKIEARATRKPKAAKATPKAAAKRTVEPRKPARKRLPKTVRLPSPTTPAEDVAAVEAVNRRYYDAFQLLSIDAIAKVWWHDAGAGCVHPGWDARHGWASVRDGYEEIIANTRSIRFSLGDVRARVIGDVAWVTCVENLVTEEGDAGDYLGAVLATNVFERRHGEWRLIHHHASPFSTDGAELPEGLLH